MHFINNTIKSVCFTGHRPQKLMLKYNENSIYIRKLKTLLSREILSAYEEGCREFYCGMAMGIDLIAGELVLKYQKTYPDVHLNVVIPYLGQPDKYTLEWQNRFMMVMNYSNTSIILQRPYTKNCYANRNKYMVERADRVVAVWNGDRYSGTSQTLRFAHELGKEQTVIRLDKNLAIEKVSNAVQMQNELRFI